MALPYVVLNDDVIRQRILGDARILNVMPAAVNFKQQLAKLDKECTTCSGKAQAKQNLRNLMQQIRQWVAHLSDSDKQIIREVLGVPEGRQAMVSYRAGEKATDQIVPVYF